MPDYLVSWTIDIHNADCPIMAAEQAWEIMRRPDSIANVFDVTDEHGKMTQVDLQELIEIEEDEEEDEEES